jgi:hypothetical protein
MNPEVVSMGSKGSDNYVIDLSTCLDAKRRQQNIDTFPDLSEASTDTPRDPVEDLSLNDVPVLPVVGDVALEQVADTSRPEPASVAHYAGQCRDAWHCLPGDLGVNPSAPYLQMSHAHISMQMPIHGQCQGGMQFARVA